MVSEVETKPKRTWRIQYLSYEGRTPWTTVETDADATREDAISLAMDSESGYSGDHIFKILDVD